MAAMLTNEEKTALASIRERAWNLFKIDGSTAFDGLDQKVAASMSQQIMDRQTSQYGSWPDAQDTTSLKLASCLTRLNNYAQAWGLPESRRYRDHILGEHLDAAARFYATRLRPEEPFPNNWWNWQVGMLYDMRNIFLFAADAFSADTHRQLLDSFGYLCSKIWDYHASANRMYTAFSLLGYGLASQDAATLEMAARWCAQSTEVVSDPLRDPQGFRRDGSYQYHGPRINLGYGLTHVALLAQAAYLLSGTPWAIARESLERSLDLLLGLGQWAVVGKRIDPFILDRDIAEPGDAAAKTVQRMLSTSLLLLDALPSRRDEVSDFCRRLLGIGVEPDIALAGTLTKTLEPGQPAPCLGGRYYPESEYAVVRRPDWGASVKMASWRTSAYAGINRLNRKGWHISDGHLILRTTGEEFDQSVLPTLDWERLSGITRADGFRLANETMGHSWFSAGATEGQLCCCGLDFCLRTPDEQLEIAARKNWFFLDDAIVATGSNIWTTAPVTMETIIRQVPLPEEWEDHVFEETTMSMDMLIGHDAVYLLPDRPCVKVWTEWREGTYAELGAGENAGQRFRRRYWLASITHRPGPHRPWGHPDTDGQYCIVYLPGFSQAEAEAWRATSPFEILQQNGLAHRLYDARNDLTFTIQQWKGAFIKSGRVTG